MGLPSRDVARPPEVDQVAPAIADQPDKDAVAVRTANYGAQIPHLVDHRCPEPIGPSASTTSVLRHSHLEGEDLPEGACRRVAVQPELVHRPILLSLRNVRSLPARGRAPCLPAHRLPPPQTA